MTSQKSLGHIMYNKVLGSVEWEIRQPSRCKTLDSHLKSLGVSSRNLPILYRTIVIMQLELRYLRHYQLGCKLIVSQVPKHQIHYHYTKLVGFWRGPQANLSVNPTFCTDGAEDEV
jgi:hypothetical protein